MTQVLALSDREFKIVMIKMLRTLNKKVDNMQNQICDIGRERASLKKIKRKCQKISTL